jgi:TolB-like protein
MSIHPDSVRAALERILASPEFATAGRHSRLLRYLVERTLAGEGDQLKEYVLGTEVFDRADSYDPRLDSIVRVEARRLRARLEDYYRAGGSADQLIISIPTGTYVPVFTTRSDTAAVVPPGTNGDRRSRTALVVIAVTAAIVVISTALTLYVNRPAQASSEPGIAVLPFEHFSTREEDARLVAQITDMVTAELAKIDRISVASRTSAARYAAGGDAVPAIAEALDVDFLLEASVVVTGQNLHLVVRLVNARSDRKVWVSEYDARATEIGDAARRIAANTAEAIQRTVQGRN